MHTDLDDDNDDSVIERCQKLSQAALYQPLGHIVAGAEQPSRSATAAGELGRPSSTLPRTP